MRVLIIFLLFSVSIWAQTYYMNIKRSDGSTDSYLIHDIQKLTFSGVGVDVKDFEKLKTY